MFGASFQFPLSFFPRQWKWKCKTACHGWVQTHEAHLFQICGGAWTHCFVGGEKTQLSHRFLADCIGFSPPRIYYVFCCINFSRLPWEKDLLQRCNAIAWWLPPAACLGWCVNDHMPCNMVSDLSVPHKASPKVSSFWLCRFTWPAVALWLVGLCVS